jgi:hypothetical protein
MEMLPSAHPRDWAKVSIPDTHKQVSWKIFTEHQWLTPVIQTTQEVEIRRITV